MTFGVKILHFYLLFEDVTKNANRDIKTNPETKSGEGSKWDQNTANFGKKCFIV